MHAGAPNRETSMMQHTGWVAAIIRKGWHQLEKVIVHVSNIGVKESVDTC